MGSKCVNIPCTALSHLNNNQMSRKIYSPCQCASTNQHLWKWAVELIYYYYISRPEKKHNWSNKEMPESCCLQKVLQQEICLCHSVQHGVTQYQTVRFAAGSDQWPEKEPFVDLLLAYPETALEFHLKLQTSITEKTQQLNRYGHRKFVIVKCKI